MHAAYDALQVLGSAFIAGGIKNKAQSFNQAVRLAHHAVPDIFRTSSWHHCGVKQNPHGQWAREICMPAAPLCILSLSCSLLRPPQGPEHQPGRMCVLLSNASTCTRTYTCVLLCTASTCTRTCACLPACVQGVNINCGLLMLAVITILMPSLLSETHTEAKGTSSELTLSRIESICMLLCYILFLFFQLYTHRWGAAGPLGRGPGAARHLPLHGGLEARLGPRRVRVVLCMYACVCQAVACQREAAGCTSGKLIGALCLCL